MAIMPPGVAERAAHEPSAVALPHLISQHLPPLGSQRPPAMAAGAGANPTQFPSADPIFRAGINQISHPPATVSPARYQTDSRLLLERFYALWIDGLTSASLRESDRYWEAVYVVSLSSMFVSRLHELAARDRAPSLGSVGGFAWLIGRALTFRAKVVCWAAAARADDGELGARWTELADEAEGLAVRVLELVGRGDKRDGRGGLRMGDGGDALRERLWGQVVDATLGHARGP
jgi:hypothetical protein